MNDMPAIVARQRSFFLGGATRPLAQRRRQLDALRRMISENEAALYEAIHADFGKSEFDTYATELGPLLAEIDQASRRLRSWARPQKVRTNLANQPGRSLIIQEPLGVCLVIGAWNYPYHLSLAPCVPALAAGNTVVLKPSELPAATSQIMAELVAEYFDPEYVHVEQGGVPETTALLGCRWDKIFFTGSTRVGRIVHEAAAKYLTPVTLELGGKSPALFVEPCDLEVGVRRLVWAKFLNAGQTCIAPDYVLIPPGIQAEFLAAVRSTLEAFQYSVEAGNYVRIIDERNLDRLLDLLEPDQVVIGGGRNRDERTIEPTIMTNVGWDDPVMQEEIFGPILPVLTYDGLDEAISEIRSRPRPLAAYLFTDDDEIQDRILREVSFGGGTINDAVMHVANPHLPFGGVGESGMGRYHGKAGFLAFSHQKSVLKSSTWLDPSIRYPPYTEGKLAWIKRLFGQWS